MPRANLSLFRRSRPLIKLHSIRLAHLMQAGAAPTGQTAPTLRYPRANGHDPSPSVVLPGELATLES